MEFMHHHLPKFDEGVKMCKRAENELSPVKCALRDTCVTDWATNIHRSPMTSEFLQSLLQFTCECSVIRLNLIFNKRPTLVKY